MAEGRANETSRVPPVVPGVAGELAERLREEDRGLDDVRRARMERSLVQAWRTRGSAGVPLPRHGAPPSRATWAGSMAASAVVGVLVGLFALQLPGGDGAPRLDRAQFELRIGDTAVQSGAVAEGQVLESGRHGQIEVTMRTSRVTLARGTRVRFDRLGEDKRLTLTSGRVEVGFHPARRGEERLILLTRAARVRVVGTELSVEVDAVGNTDVRVAEGVVEVVPRHGGKPTRVAAGGSTHVRYDDEPYERAVREAIAANLVEGDEEDGVVEASGQAQDMEGAEPDMDLSDMLEHAPSVKRAPTVTPRGRLAAARKLLRQGKHAEARRRLRALAQSPAAIRFRVEALTLVAESYTAQGYIPRAADYYRKAAHIAPGHPAGHNALFALARLLDRYTLDEQAAITAYRRYLHQAPEGALASQAREALCRLGDAC